MHGLKYGRERCALSASVVLPPPRLNRDCVPAPNGHLEPPALTRGLGRLSSVAHPQKMG